MLLLVSAALAQTAPPIVGGSATSDHVQVGMLAVGEGYDFCSGTLIHPSWVLTAAHCIEAAEQYDDAGYAIYFIIGDSWDDYDDYGVAADLIPHPDYDRRSLQHDIGLIELTEPLTEWGTYPLNEESPRSSWGSRDVTYVGYGITDYNRRDSGTRRTVDVPFYDYDDQFIYTYSGYNETPRNVCSGDSGGAALIEEDGELILAGVNSFVASDGSGDQCEGYAGATRVDANLDFIGDYVPEESDADTDADSDSDTDSDSDSDTDSDADTDLPGDTADTGEPDNTGGTQAFTTDLNAAGCGGCSGVGGAAGVLPLASLLGLLSLRRRRET